jgi:hypothetical protein
MVLEYSYAPARSLYASKFPVPDIRQPYRPVELRWSLSQLLPYVILINFFRYLRGNDSLTKNINRVLFIINFILHFIINIPFNLMVYFYLMGIFNTALIKQSLSVLCLIFIIIPISFNNSNFIGGMFQIYSYNNIDGLLAIKEILY